MADVIDDGVSLIPWDLPIWIVVQPDGREGMGYCRRHGARDSSNAGWMYTGIASAPVLFRDMPCCAECGQSVSWHPISPAEI